VDKSDQKIVHTIIALAQSFGLESVAEGVDKYLVDLEGANGQRLQIGQRGMTRFT